MLTTHMSNIYKGIIRQVQCNSVLYLKLKTHKYNNCWKDDNGKIPHLMSLLNGLFAKTLNKILWYIVYAFVYSLDNNFE